MSNRISQLSAAGSLAGTELVVVSQLSDAVTLTATTLSAQASDNSFNDSANGFVTAGFTVGKAVKVTGFTGSGANNIFSAVVTAVTAGKLTIGGTDGDVIVDDAAGESVTITQWESRRTTAQDLGNLAAIADGDKGDIVVSSGGTVFTIDSGVLTAAGRALIDDADATAQRTTLGLGTVATLASDTDTTLAANSDARVATQKAVKAYVDGIVTGGASDVMIFKGVIDCSANPNYPSADAGNLYKVSVAGKIGGASGPNVEVGDTLYCIVNGAAAGTHAAVGSSWVISQVNLDGAVTGPASATAGHVALFDGTTGKLIKDGTLTDVLDLVGSAAQGDILYRGASGWSRLGAGTSGLYLQTQGAGANPQWAAASGGGLTNWTDALNNASPNSTVPVSKLTATNAATNVDAAIISKGTGAILAQVPDSTTAGGNKRGANAVDFQMSRGAANQVAGGDYAFVAGQNNRAAGYAAVAMGFGNTVTSSYGVAVGSNISVSNSYSAGFGSAHTISGQYGFAAGGTHTVDATYGSCFGFGGISRAVYGSWVHSSHQAFGITGGAQRQGVCLQGSTNSATASVATADGNTAGGSNQLVLPNNASYVVKGTAVARQNTTGDSKSWDFTIHIERGANAAATTLRAGGTPTVIYAAAGASAWTLAFTADTTNGSLKADITGEASKTLRWAVYVDSVQVVG